jgi:hypothetical protein
VVVARGTSHKTNSFSKKKALIISVARRKTTQVERLDRDSDIFVAIVVMVVQHQIK